MAADSAADADPRNIRLFVLMRVAHAGVDRELFAQVPVHRGEHAPGGEFSVATTGLGGRTREVHEACLHVGERLRERVDAARDLKCAEGSGVAELFAPLTLLAH